MSQSCQPVLRLNQCKCGCFCLWQQGEKPCILFTGVKFTSPSENLRFISERVNERCNVSITCDVPLLYKQYFSELQTFISHHISWKHKVIGGIKRALMKSHIYIHKGAWLRCKGFNCVSIQHNHTGW